MGFLEFVLIGVVALLVFGPERLPKVVYDVSQAWRALRRGANQMRQEFEQTVAADIKADIHNSQVLQTLEQQKNAAEDTLDALKQPLDAMPFDLNNESTETKGSDNRDKDH